MFNLSIYNVLFQFKNVNKHFSLGILYTYCFSTHSYNAKTDMTQKNLKYEYLQNFSIQALTVRAVWPGEIFHEKVGQACNPPSQIFFTLYQIGHLYYIDHLVKFQHCYLMDFRDIITSKSAILGDFFCLGSHFLSIFFFFY